MSTSVKNSNYSIIQNCSVEITEGVIELRLGDAVLSRSQEQCIRMINKVLTIKKNRLFNLMGESFWLIKRMK